MYRIFGNGDGPSFSGAVVFLVLSIVLHASYTGEYLSSRYSEQDRLSEMLMTAAIVSKIYRTNMRGSHANGNLAPVVTAILESGVIYSLTTIILLACLVVNSIGLFVVIDAIPPLIVS